MFEILKEGGWGMLPILVCSAIGLAIVLERFWTLRRGTVLPPGLGEQVRGWAHSQQLSSSHIQALRENSPLGELLAGALDVRNRSRAEIKERIEDTGRHVVHRMERYLNTLGTIASAAPLLGLLGTVIGMIEIFGSQAPTGGNNPALLAHGISVALYNTAFGLIIAIPSLMFYRYFRGLVDAYTLELEQAAHRMVPHLMRFA
ncbi:MAG TPA: MotA/TolQ/ExbB proton channel family protein, partial [Rhodanobacteraceae bacterium]|nr:MotA/TolQ/ExbB proton channel family protein [Rhodanobacteraceae bacterium]